MSTNVPPGMGASPGPSPAESAQMGAVARMLNVFFEPRKVFTDIGRKPSFLAPIILFMVMGVGFAWMMNQRVDWGGYIRGQAEKQERFAQLSEEQKQQALAPQTKYAPMFAYGGGLLGTPITVLILSALYMFGCNTIGGAQLKFSQSAGVVAHGLMPSAVGSVLAFILMAARDYGDVTPENLLASHVGALLPADAPAALVSLGGSIEVFWLWCMVLLAIGLSAAASATGKKLKTGTTAGIVFGIWILWVMVKVGFAVIVS